MQIKIELDDEQLRAKLRELIRLGNDLSPITVAISEELKAITESAFQKEQDPATGKAWAKLSDVTLARRKKSGHTGSNSTKKLQVGRDLLNSIIADHDKHSAIVGTNLAYATTQQFGAKKGEFGSFSIIKTRQVVQVPWGDVPSGHRAGLDYTGCRAAVAGAGLKWREVFDGLTVMEAEVLRVSAENRE